MSRISDFRSGLVPRRRPPPPPVANPLSQRAAGDRRPVVLTTLLMAGDAARQRVLTAARRFARLRMVVATDDDRVAGYLAAGCVVEHLPSPSLVSRHAVRGDWGIYLDRRWQMILTKWEPALIREEGASLTDYLCSCRRQDAGGYMEEQSDASSHAPP